MGKNTVLVALGAPATKSWPQPKIRSGMLAALCMSQTILSEKNMLKEDKKVLGLKTSDILVPPLPPHQGMGLVWLLTWQGVGLLPMLRIAFVSNLNLLHIL